MAKKVTKRGNGEGTISRRKDGRWEGRLTIDFDHQNGKSIRRTFYGKTRKEVQEKMEKVKAQIVTGTYVSDRKITIGEWLDTWLITYSKPNVRIATWESYETMVRVHIKPSIGNIPLQDLRPEHLQKLYNNKLKSGRIKGGGLSPKTVGYIHTVLHMALKQATREQLVIRNVAELVNKPKQKKHEITPLTLDELKGFLNAVVEHRFFVPFLLECHTGLRRGELLGLRWQDIDFKQNTLTVKQALIRTRQGLLMSEPKTQKSRRTIPLSDEVMATLKSHKAKQSQVKLLAGKAYENADLVFCNELGHPIDPRNFTKQFARILTNANLPVVRFHDMRHSHATMLLMLNEHPKVVQERLGHSTIAMTLDTYSHILPGMQKQATEKISQALSNT
ncbi:MAG: Phage integrase [Firmicutes bacterium]|nr:Phage integrase [Bacillota bacterium]